MLKLFKYTDVVSLPVRGTSEQAVNKLNSLLKENGKSKSFLDVNSEPFLGGDVSNGKVKLYKVTPMYGNTFKPIFFGKFELSESRTNLIGEFRMSNITRIIFWVFTFIALSIQVITLPLLGTESGIKNLTFFWPLLFIMIGVLMILFSKSRSKRDVDWITKEIVNNI